MAQEFRTQTAGGGGGVGTRRDEAAQACVGEQPGYRLPHVSVDRPVQVLRQLYPQHRDVPAIRLQRGERVVRRTAVPTVEGREGLYPCPENLR